MLDLCLADSGNLYIWYVLESIHKFVKELHVLQCLFVRESNKKQRSRIVSNFKKRRLFHFLWQPSALGCNLTMWHPLLPPFKKGIPLPFSLAKKRTYLDTQLKTELTYLFWDRMFSILTSRNRMMNTFVIVKIPPHVRDSSKDKSMLFHSKKAFLLPAVWPGTEYTRTLIWKNSLLVCFESYQGIPYSHTGRVDSDVNTLLMLIINPRCKW